MAPVHPTKTRSWVMPVALVIPVLLLALSGFFAHRAVKEVQASAGEAERMVALKVASARLLEAMIDNEAGQRGYLLTGNVTFLEPYQRCLEVLPALWRDLETSIQEEDVRLQLAKLRLAAEERLRFSAETVRLQKEGRHAECVAMVSSGEGKRLMDRVRHEVAALDGAVARLHAERHRTFVASLQHNERLSWLILGLDVLLVLILSWVMLKVRRDQQLLQICAWSRTVEFEGRWVTFEEYMLKRFGINTSHGINPVEAEKLLEQMRALDAEGEAADTRAA